MIPRATYRLQLHRDFPFAAAEAIVPYLNDLGVSHVYTSPITTARPGSLHGYDVIDPIRINPELGGEDGLHSLVAALRGRGMGLVIDIVPNHMGVAEGNRWWEDVLTHGPDSEFARFFDIDWSAPMMLPILGSPLEQAIEEGVIAVDDSGREPQLVLYGERRLPLRPQGDAPLPRAGDAEGLAALVEAQHYRLAWWRAADDAINWRRFFTINELAGLRVEDPQVFEATHELYFRLYAEGLIDGVRIDHVDGLSDPGGYCRQLRARFDALDRDAGREPGSAWIVIEKILGPGERLATGWQVDGTSGYDFMEEAAALLHDPAGDDPLTAVWHRFSGRELGFEEEELRARRDMLSWAFQAQLGACVAGFAKLAASRPEGRGWTRAMIRRALERLLHVFPVYRSYPAGDGAPDQDAMLDRVREAACAMSAPAERRIVAAVVGWLKEDHREDAALRDACRRFQQLSAPIAAKAVEDTAFYRYGRLLSRVDVGFDAGRLAMPVEEFHAGCAQRAAHFPGSMLATATHDHKRGEDVRARLAVLSAVPDEWEEQVTRWDALADGPGVHIHPADRYALYQTLFGAWPPALPADDGKALRRYADRVGAWQEKALREAKLRSSWEEPDEEYERRCREWLVRLCDPGRSAELLHQVHGFVERTGAATLANSLAQVGLRCLVPGVPDTYQGTEGGDFSLVDPDNRRPVDYDALRRALDGDAPPKLLLLASLLELRRQHPSLFADSEYVPLEVTGARAGNVIAFTRQAGDARLTCAIAIRCARPLLGIERPVPEPEWWGDTTVSGTGSDGQAERAATLFADHPVSCRIE